VRVKKGEQGRRSSPSGGKCSLELPAGRGAFFFFFPATTLIRSRALRLREQEVACLIGFCEPDARIPSFPSISSRTTKRDQAIYQIARDPAACLFDRAFYDCEHFTIASTLRLRTGGGQFDFLRNRARTILNDQGDLSNSKRSNSLFDRALYN
jgi:hypothetical protein